jgi:glutathione synthase/RimK-type ligase-like ATP-grasp enzyme
MSFLILLSPGKDDDTKSLGGVMIQEFIPEIQTTGELSLVFIRGKYSHTVCKLPKEGDFRVQGDFGGKKSQIQPDPEVSSFSICSLFCSFSSS